MFSRCTISFVLLMVALTSAAARAISAGSSPGEHRSPAMVIGIVGGFVNHDNQVHGVVQFAKRLRRELPADTYISVFENHRWREAREQIERLLDSNHDGTLSPQEKQSARIVLYGHSWGGSETVHLAKELGEEGIPILLTIQVDSVHKRGERDSVIPANVEEAINFYQIDGWLHGRNEIRAADAQRTEILGNIQLRYKSGSCPGYPWYNRWFTMPHCAIEIDSQVWDQADTLIHSRLDSQGAPANLHPEPLRTGQAAMEVDGIPAQE